MFIYILPIIAALIGYITNLIAVKMLFHPKKQINILGLNIQGVFPKRQHVLADNLGNVVANELITTDDLKEKLTSDATSSFIKDTISKRADDFLNNGIKEAMPMAAMFLNDDLKAKLKVTLLEQLEPAMNDILEGIATKAESSLNIKDMVTEKVKQFSGDRLESMLKEIMSKEFHTIEIIGGILGFIIGLVQVAIIKLPEIFPSLAGLF